MTDIKGFFGNYRFLSNFWMAEIVIDDKKYASSEHYYQAMKAKSEEDHEYIRLSPTAGEAKKRGLRVEMRDDWDMIKTFIMFQVVEEKFRQHNDLKMVLLATGDAYLEETNHWGDKFWGVCQGEGRNVLGKILMAVRETLRNEQFYEKD